MISIKLFLGVVFISTIVAIGKFDASSAQQVRLEQQINPIECIYTSTETGIGTNVDGTCDDQPIPLVTSVIANNGRPVLKGVLSAARTVMLRVWINGQWYTHGTDARLTVDGDLWELDLSGLNTPLAAGVYTVMIEVETNDGLVLRNTEAATFEIVGILISTPQQPLPSSNVANAAAPFFTRMVLPQTQEATEEVAPLGSLPVMGNMELELRNDMKNTPLLTSKFQISATAVVVAVLVIVVLFCLFRYVL